MSLFLKKFFFLLALSLLLWLLQSNQSVVSSLTAPNLLTYEIVSSTCPVQKSSSPTAIKLFSGRENNFLLCPKLGDSTDKVYCCGTPEDRNCCSYDEKVREDPSFNPVAFTLAANPTGGGVLSTRSSGSRGYSVWYRFFTVVSVFIFFFLIAYFIITFFTIIVDCLYNLFVCFCRCFCCCFSCARNKHTSGGVINPNPTTHNTTHQFVSPQSYQNMDHPTPAATLNNGNFKNQGGQKVLYPNLSNTNFTDGNSLPGFNPNYERPPSYQAV